MRDGNESRLPCPPENPLELARRVAAFARVEAHADDSVSVLHGRIKRLERVGLVQVTQEAQDEVRRQPQPVPAVV